MLPSAISLNCVKKTNASYFHAGGLNKCSKITDGYYAHPLRPEGPRRKFLQLFPLSFVPYAFLERLSLSSKDKV